MELWHNPRCSKSRAAKEILDQRGVAYAERRYLDDPPDAEPLDAVLTALGREPWEVVANPILIERPILIADDGRAVLGRPPEAVAGLL